MQISSEALEKLNLTADPVFQDQGEHAVQLAWRILTCVPPLVVCQPIKYSKEWHELMPAHWTSLSGQFDLVYYQPVLLSSPSGPVKEKGLVGRVESEDPENCVNTEEEEDLSSEQEDCHRENIPVPAQQISPDLKQKNHSTSLPLPDTRIDPPGSKCCALV